MKPENRKESDERIVSEILDHYFHSIEFNSALFIIVQYEHEADKVRFMDRLREACRKKEIFAQTLDPRNRLEEGAGKTYGCLESVARQGGIAIISTLPHSKEEPELDNTFLGYLNLHRDEIVRKKLRFLLFIPTTYAEQFIMSAGDLWDFRHQTYWLERNPEENRENTFWQNLETQIHESFVAEEDSKEVEKYIKRTRSLVNRVKEKSEKASLLLDLTKWLSRRNRYQPAIEAALEGIAMIPNEKIELRADLEHQLGYALRKISNNPEALEHYQNALEIRREIGDKSGEGTTLNNISQIYDARGDYDRALEYLKDSLSIQLEIGDKSGEGATLNNISQIYDARGDYDRALEYLKDSLKLRREIGDKSGEGTTLNNISTLYHARGDYDRALEYLKDSLSIQQEIGDKSGEGTTLNNISTLYYASGDYDRALEYLKESLSIQREIGDKSGEGAILNNVSQIYDARGDYDRALEYLKESLSIQREIGDKSGLCATLFNIGHIHWANEDKQGAFSTWIEVHRVAKEIGDAQALKALEELANSMEKNDLKFWEELTKKEPTSQS